ncbi:helix-turn-helix domain-containing protein [Arthrobacter sp. GCM10027362]|uniref:helix-turn-helix domain-containing protein n=1 Tax=Arthrobacter sp. GCM10027362 TaxID=3273379 RepID=UPI003643D0D2
MQARFALERQRSDFFDRGLAGPGLRPELLESWHRSKAMGVAPDQAAPPAVPAGSLDRSLERLLSGPLDHYAQSLADTGLSLLLADGNGAILSRWCTETRLASALDRINSIPGAVLSEATVGTNGVGTPLAARRPVEISRAEHVADLYRSMACAGAPVRDPFTGEILGVVAIAGQVKDDSTALLPVLDRLLAGLSRQVFAAPRPPDPDPEAIRSTAGGFPLRPELQARAERLRRAGGLGLVTGEPGSGKTGLASGRGQPLSVPVRILDARLEQLYGTAGWLREARAALSAPGSVVIRHVFALSALPALKALLAGRRRGCAVFLTANDADLSGHEQLGAVRLEVPALRGRPRELESMLAAAVRGRAWSQRPFALDAAARRALLDYPWPGNLAEFAAIMDELSASPPAGLADLPRQIRDHARPGGLLQRSEAEAIDRAIAAAGGNISEAARLLGIGRATLYRKLRGK